MKNKKQTTTAKAYFKALKLTGTPYYKWAQSNGFPLTTLFRAIKGKPLSPDNAWRLSVLTKGVLTFERLCFGSNK